MNRDVYKIDFNKLENGDEMLRMYQELQTLGYDMNLKIVESDDEKNKK